jgi:hypothetical protein
VSKTLATLRQANDDTHDADAYLGHSDSSRPRHHKSTKLSFDPSFFNTVSSSKGSQLETIR